MVTLGAPVGAPGAWKPLRQRPVCGRHQHSSTHAVGEASVHVQGESLKTGAAPLTRAFQLPDHQAGPSAFQRRPEGELNEGRY